MEGRTSNQEVMTRHTGSEDIQRLPSNNSLGEQIAGHQQSIGYLGNRGQPWP